MAGRRLNGPRYDPENWGHPSIPCHNEPSIGHTLLPAVHQNPLPSSRVNGWKRYQIPDAPELVEQPWRRLPSDVGVSSSEALGNPSQSNASNCEKICLR